MRTAFFLVALAVSARASTSGAGGFWKRCQIEGGGGENPIPIEINSFFFDFHLLPLFSIKKKRRKNAGWEVTISQECYEFGWLGLSVIENNRQQISAYKRACVCSPLFKIKVYHTNIGLNQTITVQAEGQVIHWEICSFSAFKHNIV